MATCQTLWKEPERAGPGSITECRIAALLDKAWLKLGYRDVEVCLNGNKENLAEFRLKAPDHNTIWRTMTFLPEEYLKESNHEVAAILKRGTTHSRRLNRL